MTNKQLIPPLPLLRDFINFTDEETQCFSTTKQSDEFKSALSFRDQIRILGKNFEQRHIPVPFTKISNVFEKSKQSVRNQYIKSQHPHFQVGRPPSLSQGEINMIIEYVKRLHSNPHYSIFPSYSEITDYFYISFGKNILPDTLRNIIRSKMSEEFKTCVGIPLDQDRYNASLEDIEQKLCILKENVEGVPSNFVYFEDEVGHSQYADSNMKTVIVPKSCKSKTVPYPVQKNSKHASVILCISPVGISCKPFFTVPRATFDPQIYDHLQFDSFEVIHTDSGYVNTAVFNYWLTNIFVPTLREKREQYNYHGKTVLILDGFVGHINALDQIDLDDENLIIHYLVPHTSDMLQPLDVCFFG